MFYGTAVQLETWSVCCWKLQKCNEMHDEFILFVDIIRKKLDKLVAKKKLCFGGGGGGGGGGGCSTIHSGIYRCTSHPSYYGR
jgi:hypothetical protein